MEAKRNITNDIVTDYINGFYKPITDSLGLLRINSESEHVPIILKETETFLKTLLKIIEPKRILEIGCAVGYSAMFFAELTGAQVYTIEKDHEVYLKATANVERMGYADRVKIFEGDGEEVIRRLADENTELFDFVFIDAAKSHYKRFLEAALPLCSENAVIAADNVLFKARIADDIYDPTGKHKTNIKKMREFVNFINEDARFDSCIMAVGDGLSITRLK